MLAVVAPPVHKYVPPPVAVKLIDGLVQLMVVVPVLFVMKAEGATVLPVIFTLLVAVHPLAAVMVTL